MKYKKIIIVCNVFILFMIASCTITRKTGIETYNKEEEYKNRIIVDEILDGTILVTPHTYYFIPLESCKSYEYNNSAYSTKKAINIAQASGNFEDYRKSFEELSKLNPVKAIVKYPSKKLLISVTSNSRNDYVEPNELYIIPIKARMIVELSSNYVFNNNDSVATEEFSFSWFGHKYTYNCIFSDDYYKFELKSFDILEIDYNRLNKIIKENIIL
jgi:hypothetical protein